MNKVFFVKMRNVDDIKNRTFTANQDRDKVFNGIDCGDFAFVRAQEQGITELWKAIKWEQNKDEKILRFDLICHFDEPLNISHQFVALKLFKLDKNLLNKISRPFKGICFFELEISSDSVLDIIKNETKIKKYVSLEDNYRKILIHENKNNVIKDSEDVQIYKNEAGIYEIYPAQFLDKSTIIAEFNGYNFIKGKYAGGTKGQIYKIIESGAHEIKRDKATLISFYDLFISDNDTTQNKRKGFIDWCKNNGVASASNYENGLRTIEKEYELNIDNEFEDDNCQNLLNQIKNDPKVKNSKQNQKGNQRNWDSYLRKFIVYKNSLNNKSLVENNYNLKSLLQEDLNDKIYNYISQNTIFYGVPGSGKSYYEKELLKDSEGNNIPDKFYKRVLFHPEYTYSDFIGQIMPETIQNKIEYKFKAGPFIEILRDALVDYKNQYFLIIEEINRGNAPAIFGDIFQLLDRDENGKSEYEIYNRDIINWLNENGLNNISKIYIPSNLTIFATMNTSDQNVFTLDTAFKRRWRMHRIENNFNDPDDPILKDNVIIKFNSSQSFTWKNFAKAINNDILNNCNDGRIAEDKLLGIHFIKENEIKNIRLFSEKVLMYLWNDVVKYNKEELFRSDIKTLDILISKFISGENVFNDNCENIKKLYNSLLNQNLMG